MAIWELSSNVNSQDHNSISTQYVLHRPIDWMKEEEDHKVQEHRLGSLVEKYVIGHHGCWVSYWDDHINHVPW